MVLYNILLLNYIQNNRIFEDTVILEYIVFQ